MVQPRGPVGGVRFRICGGGLLLRMDGGGLCRAGGIELYRAGGGGLYRAGLGELYRPADGGDDLLFLVSRGGDLALVCRNGGGGGLHSS